MKSVLPDTKVARITIALNLGPVPSLFQGVYLIDQQFSWGQFEFDWSC